MKNNYRSRPDFFTGKAADDGDRPANKSIGPAGVMAMACRHRGPDATSEAPSGGRGWDQPATRERPAGPYGVAERLTVPMKPGNAGEGKGPQLKTNARSDEGHGDWR